MRKKKKWHANKAPRRAKRGGNVWHLRLLVSHFWRFVRIRSVVGVAVEDFVVGEELCVVGARVEGRDEADEKAQEQEEQRKSWRGNYFSRSRLRCRSPAGQLDGGVAAHGSIDVCSTFRGSGACRYSYAPSEAKSLIMGCG